MPSTKYLAKKYFDIYLFFHQKADTEDYLILIITCLRLSVKFNQSQQKGNSYTIQFCIAQSGGKFTSQEFNNFEGSVLVTLGFDLRLTTPYQFSITTGILPKMNKVTNAVNAVIDFALSLSQLRGSCAQSVYFGSLLYLCYEKKVPGLVYKIIKAITLRWEQSIAIARIIEQRLKAFQADSIQVYFNF